MANNAKRSWQAVIQPLVMRPPRLQIAALCYRVKDGKLRILLVTSRGAGRWIVPKGWPIDGLDASETALREAWEEGGVRRGRVGARALGRFGYRKRLNNLPDAPCEAEVFPVLVEKMSNDFPERKQRRRRWVSPKRAARMVEEPGLRDIILAFAPPVAFEQA